VADVAAWLCGYAEHPTTINLSVWRTTKSWPSVACSCQCSRTEKGL